MRAFLIGGVIAYSLLGLLVAAGIMPQRAWTCPDPAAPHGYTTHHGYADPPRDDCRPTATAGEHVLHFVLVPPGWLPLGVVTGLS